MVKKKPVRNRGKISLSRYFQTFDEGDFAAINTEPAVNTNFPKRIQGKTGQIKGKQGKSYLLKIRENKKGKNFLIEPVHLIKIDKKDDRR